MKQQSTKRADGRLVKSITDPRTGERVYFYGATEREINRKVLAFQTMRENGRAFSELAYTWWDRTEPQIAVQSAKTYRPALTRAVAHFGDRSVADIKPKDLALFIRSLGDQGYAQKTVSNQRLVLNLIFTFAVTTGEIEFNPCASVAVPKNLQKKKRTAASSNDEEAVRKYRDVWAFPYIALLTGMRKGEILALQWKDVDLTNRVIHVTKSVYHDKNTPHIKVPKTPTSIRDVPIVDELAAFLSEQPKHARDDFLINFDADHAGPLSEDQYNDLMARYRKETGIQCTAHQLRHSFATIAFEADVPEKSVQHILGHSQLSTTMDIYTDFRKKSFENAAQILNNAFSSKH